MTMTSTSTAPSGAISRDETGRLLGQTMGLVALTAAVFALGAYIGRDTSGAGAILCFVGAFGVLLGMNAARSVPSSSRSGSSSVSGSCSWALVALIVFGIVLIFVEIRGGALIYAITGLVIFAGLTLFDFQRLRRTESIRTAPHLAASIFLDVLNVFLLFLLIFGRDSYATRVMTSGFHECATESPSQRRVSAAMSPSHQRRRP